MTTRRKSTRTKAVASVSQRKPTELNGRKSRYEFKSTNGKTKLPQETEEDEQPSHEESEDDGPEYTPQPKTKRRVSSTVSDAKKLVTSPRKRRLAVSDEEDAEESRTYDSDALDEDSDAREPAKKKPKKTGTSTSTPSKPASPGKAQASRKKRKRTKEEEEEDEPEYDLAEGQEVVGIVVQAPKTGHVPPGQISNNTLDFLNKLRDPACNDRQWFKLHEPVYRLAEKEWKDFVEEFTNVLVEVDPQIPPLPPKDVIHRIYRDIRFSNDKTPYKKGFSASFSRSGRKGIFACYHISVRPGNESIIGAGAWCPGRDELATIRSNIQRNPRRLRNVISAPEFVKFFGKPMPHPKGESQNIFGYEDELKKAPKGVEKDHKDIDLLKCRSFVVSHTFTDSEVLASDFKERLADVARIMQPFVHCLNDMMTINGGDDSDDDDEDEDEQGDAEE